MTDAEIITAQTRKIMEQEADLSQAKEKFRQIRMQLICIGAPLNDNFLQYSKEQLKPFFKIENILDGRTN